MRFQIAVAISLLSACGFAPGLPDLPERDRLPIGSDVNTAYEEVLAAPENSETNGALGIVLHRHDDFADAETLYHRAYLLDPEAVRWLYYIGDTQASQDRYSAAAGSLRRVLLKDPTCLPAKVKLAELFLRMENLVEGEQLLKELTGVDESAAIAWYGLGRLYQKRAETARAAEAFRRACDLFPSFGPAHYELGFTSAQLSHEAEARRHFLLSEDYKMTFPPLADPLLAQVRGSRTRACDYLRLGYQEEEKGEYEQARRHYERALHIDPRSARAHARLILVLDHSGDPAAAAMHYRRAIDLDSDLAGAYANYGLMLVEQKRYQEATTAFERALAINPYQPDALASLGTLLEENGHLRAAERRYRLATQCRHNFRRAHLLLATLLVNSHRHAEAFRELDAVLATEDARTPRFLWLAATQYVRAGNRAKARECLRKARKLAAGYGQMQLLDTIETERWAFR